MAERVPFNPQRTCECRLSRLGYGGVIRHRHPCKQQGVEWLAQSGEPIIPGKQYRWINCNDEWSRARGYKTIDVAAVVTRVDEHGMVYAYWHQEKPIDDQYGLETCIPNSAVIECVE